MTTELEPEYDRNRSRRSGIDTAYTVEARYAYTSPIQIAGQIFDNRWREVRFKEGPIGVPPGRSWREALYRDELLSYAAAQALRWWLHAEAEQGETGALCLETRLIKHVTAHQSETKSVSQHCIVGGDDRSNCMPDWKSHKEIV